MKDWRVSLGVAVSVGVHVATSLALSRPTAPRVPEKRPATIELAALPPPVAEPPVEEPPPPPDVPPPPVQSPVIAKRPTSNNSPATPQPAAESTPAPVAAAPLVLAGLGFSNAGIGVPTGGGAAVAASPRPVEAAASGKTRAVSPEPSLTPVGDLSKKPVPPRLDAELSRFYPTQLRERGVEGEALLRVVLGRDGRVVETSALSETHSGFASACGKALRTSRWEAPIDKSGRPVMTSLKYKCRFRVN